jgi:hypothetical protein
MDNGSCTSSERRAPFATEADRAAPPSTIQSSGGKGKAPSVGEGGGYAGVKASRLAEIHEVEGGLPNGGRPIKKRVEGQNAVSDAKLAEETRFFEEGHKVGKRPQPENQKYYQDPKAREKYRYYLSTSGNAEDDRVPGTRRHASQPRVGGEKASVASSVTHSEKQGRPASTCGSYRSDSHTSGGYGRPRSEVSRRSKSSVRSSAASEQSGYSGYSGSGYSGSVVESAVRHNPFEGRRGSACSSKVSQAPSESSRGSSRALSARNLKNHDKVRFNPPARSCASAATSASGWSQMYSENASSLYSESCA